MNPRSVVIECRAAGHPHETQVFVAGERRLAVPLYGTKSLARRVVAYFLYDGRQLEVSAAIADVPVVVDQARVGGSWTRVPIPSVLKAGAATFDVRFSEEEEPVISSARAVARAGATTTPDVSSTLVSARSVSVAPSSTPAPGPSPPRAARRLLALAVGVFVASAALTTLALVIRARAPAPVGIASVTTPPASAPVPVPAPRTSAAAATVAPLASGAGTPPLDRATERRAIDLVAQGAFVEAAPLYRQLARQHPDRPLFAEAAAHVERRAVERHGAKSAK